MECNREEAIRAKGIAEKKMQSSDFEGARKIAKKAQQLFPELENISQLLTVCDVHCSAQNKLFGTEMDWYQILQTEQSADEVTIKKQYRKFALLLHPDKNKFAGAEAAFKLVGEAHRVLTDQGKRSLYDIKCKGSVRTAAPQHQSNGNSFAGKQFGAANNFQSFSYAQFTNLNPYQPAPRQTFWTCCPSCSMRFQYYKDFMNKNLHCQSCNKAFIASDLGTQGVPAGPPRSQFPNQKVVLNQGPSKVASQSNGGNTSSMRFPDRFSGLHPMSEARSKAEVGRGSKGEAKVGQHVDVGGRKDGGKLKSDPGKPREPGMKNASRKRCSKSDTESSKSCKTGSIDDNKENGANPSEQNSGNHRRSSRQKRNVTYKDYLSDNDDFVSPPKRSRGSRSFSASEEEMKEAAENCQVSKADNSAGAAAAEDGQKKEARQKANAPLEESLPNKKSKSGKCDVKRVEAALQDHVDGKFKVEGGSESNTSVSSHQVFIEFPDPDFSDFDKDKVENCFAINQTWAIYDPLDGMPRFYARIKKVFSPGFKLQITWFEADPDDQGEIDWCDEELPVACGKFRLDDTLETEDRLMFSHQMHCIKGSGRGSYLIYPRKGETWALFKNWDIRWSSDPKKHVSYKYEFVEVVSDFVADAGIKVAYLGKVKGFVSLFQQIKQRGIVSFQVPPSDLYRFSHRIPSFRMTGGEREGVPKGSFELDPAALPMDLNECGDPCFGKIENVSMDAEVSGSSCKSPDFKAEPVMGSQRIHTAKKQEGKNLEREMSMLRRSPRRSNGIPSNHGQVDAKQYMTKEDARKDNSHSYVTQPKESSTKCQVNERMNTPKKHEKRDIEQETINLRRSPRDLSKKNS